VLFIRIESNSHFLFLSFDVCLEKSKLSSLHRFKHIELFAGCGGMSLGLDAAGFELYLANELSPMAGETFAYNIIGEDLDHLANNERESSKVLWVKSNFKCDDLKSRLRENPFTYSEGRYSDLTNDSVLKDKLLGTRLLLHS
jgi:DNA (cytosine-5)-methyltransferase 1